MSESPPKPPPFVICYLCGRKYGTKSIAIHEPHCIKKWHATNKKLPKHLRRKMPTKPDYSKLSSGDFNSDDIEEMNQASYKAAQEQLIPCGNCGRTFLPDRLQVHQKSCTVDNPMKKAGTGAMPRSKTNLGLSSNNNTDNNNGNRQSIDTPNPQQSDGGPLPKTIHKNKLCCLCMKKVPVSIMANHLVRCNDNKISEMKGSAESNSSNNNETLELPSTGAVVERRNTFNKGKKTTADNSPNNNGNSEYEDRPSTRTLKKRSTAQQSASPSNTGSNASHGTYDLDSPDDGEYDSSPPQGKPYPNRNKPKTAAHKPPTQSSSGNGPAAATSTDPTFSDQQGPGSDVQLESCRLCNRRFAADRIDRHMVICQKTTSKTRKVFDSSKQRMIEGSDPKAITASMKSSSSKTPSNKPAGNWRQQHEDFVKSIRAARQVTKHMAAGGKASDLPPPPPSLNPNYVHCQYCDRRFSPEVAERHIPKCATTMNRPKPPKQKALELHKNNNNNNKNSNSRNTNNSKPKSNYNSPTNNNKQNGGRPMSQQKQPSTAGYNSPSVDRGYQNYNNNNSQAAASNNGRQSFEKNSPRQNDPYKSKTFSGINNRTQAANRGYSYNAANHTGPNFFG